MADAPTPAQPDVRVFERSAQSIVEWDTFQGRIRIQESLPIVGIAAIRVLQNNPERVGFILMNVSGSVVTLGFSPAVVAGFGLLLGANGGVLKATLKEDGATTGWEVWGIAAGAGLQMYAFEQIRYETRDQV